MERGFLSQKGSGGGRGVKEKDLNRNKKNTSSGIGVSMDSEDTMNDDTPIGVESAVQEGATPSVVDMTVEIGRRLLLRLKVNVPTLFTPGGNGIDVVVPVDFIHAISERFANTAYGFFLGKKLAYPVVANYVRNTWGKYGLIRSMFSSSTGLFSFQFSSMDGLDAMLENSPWFIRNNLFILKKWHPDENLLKEDVSTVPVWVKLHGVPGRSSYARVMIELRADVELKDNIVVSTASSSGNKKGVEPTIKVSNSNPFDVLNSVDNDVELGTNGGTTNLFEDLLTSGQANLVDKAGNPLKKVEFRGEYDSKDEVALIDKDMARSMESKRVGFGTQSLPE
ncbi:probable leucine-rich repeat receptor-like protein kinase [Tanacetum coccineum]